MRLIDSIAAGMFVALVLTIVLLIVFGGTSSSDRALSCPPPSLFEKARFQVVFFEPSAASERDWIQDFGKWLENCHVAVK
jgi:hypothetical protein